MRWIGILVVGAAMYSMPVGMRAETMKVSPKAGEAFEIRKSYETSQQGSGGSSSSSSGQDAMVERVTSVREDGLELEYDLAEGTSAEERARSWQFPVRVFRPWSGPMELLNKAELEARLEAWLTAAGWTREMCGRWIFTWNAFRIECDPQSVIETISAFDLRPNLRDGAPYRVAEALGPGALVKKAVGRDGATFEAVMDVDPDAVRRGRAESDVAVGEIMQKPVTLDAALRGRAKEQVTGTITVTFETDPAGNVRRRTKVTKLKAKLADGESETSTAREIVERRPIAGVAARP